MPTKKGYIVLSRAMLEHPSYHFEKFCRQMAWIDLIFLANYKKSSLMIRGNLVEVPRGSLAYSKETLARRWRWTRPRVIRFLRDLETLQQIVQQKSFVITLVSIVNYNKYQVSEQQTVHDTYSERTADDTHPNKVNKRKESAQRNFYKNGFQNTSSDAPPLSVLQPDGTFKIKP